MPQLGVVGNDNGLNASLGPLVKGLHRQSDHSSIEVMKRVIKLNNRVPIIDMPVKVIMIAVALVVGATENDSLSIAVFLVQQGETELSA